MTDEGGFEFLLALVEELREIFDEELIFVKIVGCIKL
jgi:hypothetical protein